MTLQRRLDLMIAAAAFAFLAALVIGVI